MRETSAHGREAARSRIRGAFAALRGTRRKLAALGAALLLAVHAFSAAYLAHEADHDCAGHDCPVCAVLHQCVDNFQLLGSGFVPAPATAAESAAASAGPGRERRDPPAVHETLVSLKVRLDE